MADLQKIAEDLSTLTVLEASELTKILEENKNKDHFEIKLLAIVGSKNNSFQCKEKPINISIFKPKVIYHHSLPSLVIRSMYEWNQFFIDKISSDNQISLKKYDNFELNKIIESSNNFEFDYSSNVNGIPLIEHGDYLVAPVFKVEPINSHKQAENPYDIAKGIKYLLNEKVSYKKIQNIKKALPRYSWKKWEKEWDEFIQNV